MNTSSLSNFIVNSTQLKCIKYCQVQKKTFEEVESSIITLDIPQTPNLFPTFPTSHIKPFMPNNNDKFPARTWIGPIDVDGIPRALHGLNSGLKACQKRIQVLGPMIQLRPQRS
ncbi:hypothetical protein BYT27DRAFT_7208273 [Phlegmacium glaucopus]|nr:hypothetical protein BYT27DRAFT_7208273 [Phlegmacium glaucopus]